MSLMCSASAATSRLILGSRGEINGQDYYYKKKLFMHIEAYSENQ